MRKQTLKDIADSAITQAQWLKQMIEDKKRELKPTMVRSINKKDHKVGLAFLGRNYRQAYEFYQAMAKRYWTLAMTDKRSLGASKKCYVIAAENAMQIMKMFQEPTNEIRLEMNGFVKHNLQLAEHI